MRHLATNFERMPFASNTNLEKKLTLYVCYYLTCGLLYIH